MSDKYPVLECSNLTKSFVNSKFTVEVLRDINFSVAKGEMIAITGFSGSGKSTLLHLLGGLDQPTTGGVDLMGANLSCLSEKKKARLRNKHLGFVYQFHHLLPEFNALENICMPLWLRGEKDSVAKERALDMLQQVGLSSRANHRVGELSGGERQRIAIARALVTNPNCVLADEPTGNLDVDTANQVFDIMLKLNREIGTSFVLVTHSLTLADKLEKKYLLKNGELSSIE
jgi:lipoprotein-releasing system ATP-binding protein